MIFVLTNRLQLPVLTLLVSLGLFLVMTCFRYTMRMNLIGTRCSRCAARATSMILILLLVCIWPIFLEIIPRVLMLSLELALLRIVNPGPSNFTRRTLRCPCLLLEKFLPMSCLVNEELMPRLVTVECTLPS